MKECPNREQAWGLLTKYNQEPFHLQHAITLECVMDWFSKELGFEEDCNFWATVGLLHDLDFEQYPEEHLQHTEEPLRAAGLEPTAKF